MDMVAADMMVADMSATTRKNDRMKLIDVDFITARNSLVALLEALCARM